MAYERDDQRSPDEMRAVVLEPGVAAAAKGSVLISMGNTRVICGVSVESRVPAWMRAQNVEGGWVTAEYSMLPYSTTDRSRREVSQGKASGRTQEIQRLIGRSLRAVTDMKKLGPRTCWVDCDVLQADGGTRTAAITGAYVALRMALNQLHEEGVLKEDPLTDSVAAVSVGMIDGTPLLDLCYVEDVSADVDMNVVMTGSGNLIEVQGTAERETFTREQLDQMVDLAQKGIGELTAAQRTALATT